jgi:hypothetical protein
VHAVQDGYTLQALSDFKAGKAPTPPAGFPVRTKPAGAIGPMPDGLAFFERLNEILQTEAVPETDKGLLNFFSLVGIGPREDFAQKSTDLAIRSGLLRAAASTERLLKERAARLGSMVNGWQVMLEAGRYHDYLSRATLAWMGGAGANLPEDALYPMAFVDSGGKPLDGRNRYELRFEKGQTPPVEGFWSLSMYGSDQNLVSNSINRFNIGNHTKGLRFGGDGSLTIYMQAEPPSGEQKPNWLPAPADHFVLAMRAYSPKEPILDLNYQWPPRSNNIDQHRDDAPVNFEERSGSGPTSPLGHQRRNRHVRDRSACSLNCGHLEWCSKPTRSATSRHRAPD